jgi:hypothetical protein
MSKTTKINPTSNAAAKNTAAKSKAATVRGKQAPAKPLRRKGPALPIAPIKLPLTPGHGYGQGRHVSAIQIGDLMYVGGRQNLSTLEVAEVRPVKASRSLTIIALAVEFVHDGVLYTGNEQVTFIAEANSRIGVKST